MYTTNVNDTRLFNNCKGGAGGKRRGKGEGRGRKGCGWMGTYGNMGIMCRKALYADVAIYPHVGGIPLLILPDPLPLSPRPAFTIVKA